MTTAHSVSHVSNSALHQPHTSLSPNIEAEILGFAHVDPHESVAVFGTLSRAIVCSLQSLKNPPFVYDGGDIDSASLLQQKNLVDENHDKAFDVVICAGPSALTDTEHLSRLLESLDRYLSPNGRLLIRIHGWAGDSWANDLDSRHQVRDIAAQEYMAALHACHSIAFAADMSLAQVNGVDSSEGFPVTRVDALTPSFHFQNILRRHTNPYVRLHLDLLATTFREIAAQMEICNKHTLIASVRRTSRAGSDPQETFQLHISQHRRLYCTFRKGRWAESDYDNHLTREEEEELGLHIKEEAID